MNNPSDPKIDPQMDSAGLYREEVFTDRKVGAIRRLTPVKADGSPDPGRKILFVGEAQLLTSAGALPLSFEIEASALTEAVGKYAPAVRQAFESAMEELQELRRRAASSIVIPKGGANLDPGHLGPGRMPGGKLHLP
ncbi:MAG: hypothetical protein WC728_16105 [Elusimicrobiota bacterium]